MVERDDDVFVFDNESGGIWLEVFDVGGIKWLMAIWFVRSGWVKYSLSF